MAHTVKKVDTILAIDPGLRDLGYAVLAGRELLTSGVLPLRHVPAARKLRTIQESLDRLIRGYRPGTLVWEHIPKRPLDTLAGLPALGRRLRRLATRSRLKLATYSARSIRRTVAGDGWAGKREVAEALCGSFPELRVFLTHDRKWKVAYWQNMFDAAAVAVHHQLVSKPPSRSR
jgi:Holliday junction resolvasome RuvABC endonuclease subunit